MLSFSHRRLLKHHDKSIITRFLNSKPPPSSSSNNDDEVQVADETTKKQRLQRATSMAANPQHLGLGGATIRRVWEQDSADPYVTGPRFLKTPKTVSILGAPMSWGQPLAGTDHGPALVHAAGLVPALKRSGWRVRGDKTLKVEAPSQAQVRENEKYCAETGALCHNASSVGSFLKDLANESEQIALKDEFLLTIGGDHSIGLGTLAGILRVRPDTGVIWVDAHGDLHTPLTSESGNMHGMPLGILMAEDSIRCKIPGFAWLKNGPRLRPDRLVYVGCRDLDMYERRQIKAQGITCYTMSDIDRWGIGNVMERVFHQLGQYPIHLSYDIDAVDALHAPDTGTIVHGGFTFREANFIAESVAETNRLCSMDLVEINPTLSDISPQNPTVQLGLTIVASAMGQKIL